MRPCGALQRRRVPGILRAAMLPLLDWQAPDSCPDAAAMQHRLGAALQALPGGWEQATVRGRISGGQGVEWVLELELSSTQSGARSRRRLTAPECDELADAATVAIALALGAGAGTGQLTQSEPPPAVNVAPSAVEAVADAPPAERTPQRSAPWGLELGVEAVLDSGLLAGAGWGAAAGARLQRGGWSAGVYGVWLPERAEELGRGQGVDFQWLAAGIRGCAQALAGVLRLEGCAGLELGSLGASGYGLDLPADSRELLVAPALGAGVRWPQGHWALTSRLEAVLPLPRQRYTVDVGRQIHETPALVVRWTAGFYTQLLGP